MAIQMRRGKFTNFLPSKLQPGEWAIVQGEDPSATDGRSVYVAFAAGVVKRMATYTDMVDNCRDIIAQSIEDTKAKLTEKVESAIADLTEKVESAIAEVKATEAKLYPAAENVLVGSETGTFVHVDDAFSGATLRGITVEGACRQDGTPSPDNPVPIQVVENPVVKVTGRNLANPAEAYYQDAAGKPKAEQIADGFRFTATDDHTRIIFIPCEARRGDTIVVNFDSKIISGTKNLQIYFPDLNSYLQVGKPHVMDGDGKTVGVYIERGKTGVYEITNFRMSRNVDDGYAPYTFTEQAFTLPAEHPYLAKLPNGTADAIEVDEAGNVELVARVCVDNDVRTISSYVQGSHYSLKTKIPPFSSYDAFASGHGTSIALCSALPSNSSSTSVEGVYRSWNSIIVRDTSRRTKEEVQAEIDKNAPLTVVAVMPETRYQLGKIDMPALPESVSNVWTDAEVTTRSGIKYTRDVNIVVANLESAIASIAQG